MKEQMKAIAFTRTEQDSSDALDNGSNLIMTGKLDDMTEPSMTIYSISGASTTSDLRIAKEHGYLNIAGDPLAFNGKEYPISITSPIYMDNFMKRLEFLRYFTKWPHGIHVGGSNRIIEHCIPESRNVASSYWCYGFEDHRYHDPETTTHDYQIEVFEDVTNELIERAQKVFPSLKMITTAFRCPSAVVSRKDLSMMTTGTELWNVLKRMKQIHSNWYNIYIDAFTQAYPNEDTQLKMINLKMGIDTYDLSDRMLAGGCGNAGALGRVKEGLSKEASLNGTGYLAYMTGFHAGIVNEYTNHSREIRKSIDILKKLPII